MTNLLDKNAVLRGLRYLNRSIRTIHGEFVIASSIAKQYHMVKKNSPCYSDNEKCKIVFIVERTEVYPSIQSIVEAATSNANCEVFLLPVPRCNFAQYDLDTLAENEAFCKKINGVNVINSYNYTTKRFFDLREICPHFIFLCVPYTEEYPELYNIKKLSEVSRVCFVDYGFMLNNEKYYSTVSTTLNLTLLQYTSFIFSDSPVTYNFCAKRLWLSKLLDGSRLFNLGFPRFDNIESKHSKKNPSSLLWIPRWTTDEQVDNSGSSFFKCKDAILDFAKEHSDSNIIIRPHPSAFINYVRCGKMTEDEVETYKHTIANLSNTTLDNKSSYLPAINEADIMIADCSSIVIEFFARNKPIIYTGKQNEMSQRIRYISDTFYYASTWNEIERIILDLKNGNDPKKAQREAAVKRFMKDHGHAGEKIVQELLKRK